MTVVALVLAVTVGGWTDDADDLRAAVDRWVAQLEAPTLSERSRAERELLELGPKILPWLPPKELLPGVASRDAVQRLRIQLQRQLARDSARPSRVTLSGAYSLNDLVKEVARQTGNSLRAADSLSPDYDAPRPWKFEDATFWETIDSISDELGLSVTATPDSDQLVLTRRPSEQKPPPVCRAGVLHAELFDASWHAISGDPQRKLLRLQADLTFEPRLRPLFVHFRAGDFSAVTPDGKSFDSWNPMARYELPMAGASRRTTVRWDFVAPTADVVTTVALKGKVLVHLAGATEAIRFDQLAARKEILRRRGGVSVRLHETRFEEESDGSRTAAARITVSYDAGGPAFESHRTWVYHNAAWLEDTRRRYPFADFDTLLQSDGSVQLEYRFKSLPAADSLAFVYEAPTLLLDVPFELTFQNVAVK